MKVNDNIYMLKIPSKMQPDQFTHPVIITNKDKILLIDSAYPGELETIKNAFYNEGLDINNLSHIILTHKGFDNLGCTKNILKTFPNIKVMAHSNDGKFSIDVKLNNNDFIPDFKNVRVISTPGHSPGHISLYVKDQELLVAGNLLDIELNLLKLTDKGLNIDNQTYINSVKKVSNLSINKVISYHGGMLEGTITQGIKCLVN
ncbi:MAG: MBL fold metallo-hydrolase [Terrisporobacter sp.]|uniref:MBL fold metallo-hydrolase n=1 Tax=Terrisporobacter sp. TaxID=1965305 RepID=UPI002FC732C1